MPGGKQVVRLSLVAVCIFLGMLLVVQLRTQSDIQQAARREDWSYVVAELIDSNTRLREEIEALQAQLVEIRDVEAGAAILELLVDDTNNLRIANGLVEVSGPGIEVMIADAISVLDLHDLINELRNAGAEALALNGQRLVVWSAISTDGQHVTVDGQPVQAPYHLEAIGNAHTLEAALVRPGGLVNMLHEAQDGLAITVEQRQRITLTVYRQPIQFVYAQPAE